MATIYVVHAPADRAFVTSTLLRPLPSLGFGRWIAGTRANATAIASCKAAIVVVSAEASRSPIVRDLAARALAAKIVVVPVRHDGTSAAAIVKGLGRLPTIDLARLPSGCADDRTSRLRARLPELLPAVAAAGRKARAESMAIAWDAECFSDYLHQAVARHDFSRGYALLDALEAHLRERTTAYPASYARVDLKGLRSKRQFPLMERFARLVRGSGTQDWQIERQLGQALIERGRFPGALTILKAIVDGAAPNDEESTEARGLIGRAYKQQYVNAPHAPGAARRLRRAYDAYATVHDAKPDKTWHGINAVSIELRAHRDRLAWADPKAARARAERILSHLDSLTDIDVWDRATRVEALVALDRFADAADALQAYLADPQMDAFEVSSTFRQFDEVLQVGPPHSQGAPLHARLLRAADRYRTGGTAAVPGARVASGAADQRSIIIRVSDPDWQPPPGTSLTLGARLGTVISARATTDDIRALLKDPVAISIEESRPAADTDECEQGLPFVQVQDSYLDSGGTFGEDGARAFVGIIDNGIDVLHEAFLDDAGQTRIAAIWDQSDKNPNAPRPAPFTYGRLYSRAEIQAIIGAGKVDAPIGRNLGVKTKDGRRPGHGTHVASIAAGRKAGAFHGGLARGAGLIVVIVKPEDVEIGYSKAHIDALGFIAATAGKEPVVVNVSRGMNGGAHDGQSALEVAFNEFSNGGRLPGRVVVKSSGNQCASRWHARLNAAAPVDLRWTRPADPMTTSPLEHIELWWHSANDLKFRLTSPGNPGDASEWVTEGAPDFARELQPGGDVAMQLVKRHVDNGDSLLRITIGGPFASIAAGTWTLEIAPVTIAADPTVHAWISTGKGAPSAFETFVDDGLTLTVPGTAQSVITVGALAIGDPNVAPTFSSRGPTRDGRQKPDVAAPGVDVVAAMSGTADGAAPESGTSMAAPYVTGAIALVLSRAAKRNRPVPSANQLRAALIQKARRDGTKLEFDPWRGYGVLDVAALLAAF
jgi:subtilisin family serine protease